MKGKYRINRAEYRDDRKYVMNLHSRGDRKWELITYLNTGGLPPVRNDTFVRKSDAITYVKVWEPSVPLISRKGQPWNFASKKMKGSAEVHREYEAWLENKNLFGTLSLRQHCPYWHDERGWTEKQTISTVKKVSIKLDGFVIDETTTSIRGGQG